MVKNEDDRHKSCKVGKGTVSSDGGVPATVLLSRNSVPIIHSPN